MAVAVIGGLTTSTFLTLVLVPVVFTYVDDFKNWLFNRPMVERITQQSNADNPELLREQLGSDRES